MSEIKEYYGVRFSGISPEKIDYFIKQVLGISSVTILHSHFYTKAHGDFEYSDDLDLMTYCNESHNIATIDTKNLRFHKRFNHVLCMIYPDTQSVEVECCGIASVDFPQSEIGDLEMWLQELQKADIVKNTEIFYDDEW